MPHSSVSTPLCLNHGIEKQLYHFLVFTCTALCYSVVLAVVLCLCVYHKLVWHGSKTAFAIPVPSIHHPIQNSILRKFGYLQNKDLETLSQTLDISAACRPSQVLSTVDRQPSPGRLFMLKRPPCVPCDRPIGVMQRVARVRLQQLKLGMHRNHESSVSLTFSNFCCVGLKQKKLPGTAKSYFKHTLTESNEKQTQDLTDFHK